MANILIVDDRPANREFLVTLLSYSNHQLLEASDGAEALELVRAERPDLVITDILMPTMDGYEFVRLLRSDPELASTQVIFCTAHYHERETRMLAEGCGVSHILFKPCEPEDILRTVEAALNQTSPVAMENASGDEFDREHLRIITDKLSEKANELRAVNEQLNALIEVNLQLASELQPERMLEILCRSAREIVGAKYASIELTERNRHSLHHFFVSGMDAKIRASMVTPDERAPVIESLLSESQSVRLRDLQNDPEGARLPPYRPPIVSFVGASVASLERIYGWLCLTDKIGMDEFSEKDERIVSILASLAGRVYENRRLYSEVQNRSIELEQEVIERKRAEEALRESEQQFRAIFDGALESMLIADDEGRYIDANPAACALFGLSKADLIGRSIREFVEDGYDFAGAWQAFLDQGWMTGEFRLVRPDRTIRHLEFSATANILPGRHLSVLHDTTERNQLEDQLYQAQKMEAIGRLAGGIAHDFNNLLTAIIGYSQLVMMRLGKDNPMYEEIEEIQKAGERAAALTSQLLAFSRRQILQPRVLNLNTIIVEVEKLLRRLIGEDVELVTHLEPSLWQVKADPGQIAQVVMNLAVNARDAMPEGGSLIIETSNVVIGETYVNQHLDVEKGHYVLLAVSDSGVGMNEDIRSHLFEPFYTTKEQGKGTGLGLSTVYGIVKQSGGHIWAYSEPGQGATFKIYLPQAEGQDDDDPLLGENVAIPSGTETVLIVEDEEMLRELIGRILRTNGYSVLNASSGEEAIHIIEDYPGAIHLLLTDVVMPQMSGPDLAAGLLVVRPTIRVLFMSGYTDRAIMHKRVLDAKAAYLQKPFTPEALARKVREVLDGAP